MKKIITIKNAPAPVGPYSQAIKKDNTLYASGQIAIDPISNELVIDTIHEETHQVMKISKQFWRQQKCHGTMSLNVLSF